MNQDQSKELCRICNLPRTKNTSASLTQWIMVCSCNERKASETEEEEYQDSSSRICQKCGKRMAEGRKGSFTQWILRSDICDCDFPIAIEKYSGSQTDSTDVVKPEETGETEEESELELDLDPGKFPLDRFKPLEELGAGATSKVFLARDRFLSKKVAVKCLLSVSPDLTVRFQKEAKLNTLMKHPNIVQAMDVGITDGGTPYMVLEYFDGRSLNDLVMGGILEDEKDSLDIFHKILSGVEYAHSKDILHHDLKPDNILVKQDSSGESWQVKIIDFGYALGLADQSGKHNQSESGEELIVGSPHFMAPDQPKGITYDKRSEIYSLGCIFHFLLTGKPPYMGETSLDILNKHATESIPELQSEFVTDSTLEAMQPLVNRCLAKEPESRYQTVSDLLEELERVYKELRSLKKQEDSLVSPGIGEINSEGRNGKNRLARTAVILAIGILTGGSVLLYLLNRTNSDAPAVEQSSMNSSADRVEPANISSVLATNKNKAYSGEKFKKAKDGSIAPVNMALIKDEDLKLLTAQKIPFLSLTACSINGSGLKYLQGKEIGNLRLNSTDITDESLKHVRKIKGLRTLHLSATGISGRGLKNLKGMNIRRLFLYSATRIDDDALKLVVEQFPRLNKLSVGDCVVTLEGVKYLKEAKKLKNLNINCEYINDDTIEIFQDFRLNRLILGNVPITNKGLLKLSQCETLKSLALENCHQVNKKGIKALKKLRPDIKISETKTHTNLKFINGMSESFTKRMLKNMGTVK